MQKIYQKLMKERDQIRSGIRTPPKREHHVSIAIFEAWADGRTDEGEVQRQIAEIHGKTRCSVCLDNLAYYRARQIDQSLSACS
jgi:hypothetical protein